MLGGMKTFRKEEIYFLGSFQDKGMGAELGCRGVCLHLMKDEWLIVDW